MLGAIELTVWLVTSVLFAYLRILSAMYVGNSYAMHRENPFSEIPCHWYRCAALVLNFSLVYFLRFLKVAMEIVELLMICICIRHKKFTNPHTHKYALFCLLALLGICKTHKSNTNSPNKPENSQSNTILISLTAVYLFLLGT